MGLFDKVKEKAADALEQGKDVAQTQQLKLQLKKLEGEDEEAHRRVRRRGFDLHEAGTLAMSARSRRRSRRASATARAAVEAKKAEMRAPAATTTSDDGERGDRQRELEPAGSRRASRDAATPHGPADLV